MSLTEEEKFIIAYEASDNLAEMLDVDMSILFRVFRENEGYNIYSENLSNSYVGKSKIKIKLEIVVVFLREHCSLPIEKISTKLSISEFLVFNICRMYHCKPLEDDYGLAIKFFEKERLDNHEKLRKAIEHEGFDTLSSLIFDPETLVGLFENNKNDDKYKINGQAEKTKQVLKLYSSGKSTGKIAKETNLSTSSVSRILNKNRDIKKKLKRNQITINDILFSDYKKPKKTENEEEQIIKMYNSSYTYREISNTLNVSNCTIVTVLKRNNIERNRKSSEEKDIQRNLAFEKNGKTEVYTSSGYIDVLTDKELIEIKNVNYWKSAIGQLLSYGEHYPNLKKHLYLFGQIQQEKEVDVETFCEKYDIKVTFYK